MASLSKSPDRAQSRVGRTLALSLALGFLAIIGAAVAAVWLQVRNQELSGLVEHTLEVEAQISEVAFLNERVETARRGYLLARDPSFRAIFEEESEQLKRVIERLRGATADNPAQLARVNQLEQLLARAEAEQRASMARVDAGARPAELGSFGRDMGVAAVREARTLASAMREEEARLLAERNDAQLGSLWTFYLVLGAAGLLVVMVAAATMMVVMRYTRELDASRGQLATLNEGLEEAVQARTAELQRANEEIQRFAYIVSHDLRSPLVNVMGFTSELDAARRPLLDMIAKVQEADPELVSREARLAVEEDLPEAVGFIRSSTAKMDRLINAILKLSREGRRTLAPERVDSRQLVQTIVDNLHQRIGDAGAEVRIGKAMPELVTDRLALDQILSNLVENAIKYLSPDRPGLVEVDARREGERVVFTVRDNGRGIDPKDHQRIFDLFRRSGAQDRPGEGIGLAHVRAVAYRLGGVIDVQSELDRGATFRLSLPTRIETSASGDGAERGTGDNG